MSQDGLYWLFTSAAQSVAAFIALLLAGFALVVNMLDQEAERDETLVEIHKELKTKYYRKLRDLSELTGTAILGDLATVLIQGYQLIYSQVTVVSIVCLLNAAAVVLGIRFIILVADPGRIGKTAQQLLKAERPAPGASNTPITEFVAHFINVERELRRLASEPVLDI
jgi:hypothetical protein